jgi:hypothetical protein
MSSPPSPPIDPVSVATTIAAAIIGTDLAALIGPYAVIIVASAIGASWSLAGRPPMSSRQALRFVIHVVALACAVSVGIEAAISRWLTPVPGHWLLAPIAIAVGAIGDRWPAIGAWLLDRAGKAIDRRIGGAS